MALVHASSSVSEIKDFCYKNLEMSPCSAKNYSVNSSVMRQKGESQNRKTNVSYPLIRTRVRISV